MARVKLRTCTIFLGSLSSPRNGTAILDRKGVHGLRAASYFAKLSISLPKYIVVIYINHRASHKFD